MTEHAMTDAERAVRELHERVIVAHIDDGMSAEEYHTKLDRAIEAVRLADAEIADGEYVRPEDDYPGTEGHGYRRGRREAGKDIRARIGKEEG